ncbi:uncharacterized protein TNCV_5016581 [Trichonephila clavipes]|nr:uncharacterized protein TNCV_5016581 [Trichonephila clavipes]
MPEPSDVLLNYGVPVPRPEGLGLDARCHQTPSKWHVTYGVPVPKNRGRTSSHENYKIRAELVGNCGGGDRGRVAIYRPFGEFRRAKIVLSPVWCLRPTSGVPLAHATMNFVGLDLTTSDRSRRSFNAKCSFGRGNFDTNSSDIIISGDGTWKTRGYSSRVGVCAVIGDKTGKCIDAEVMSSFCKGCDSWKRRKGSPAYKKWKILHVKECLKNHNGSAGMMETVGMVRIFQRSLSHRSVRYTSYIGDGDSKTFSSITASNPYGEDITVSKN